MNAEQKQRAAELLAAWRATAYALHGDRMADLLQELVGAPDAEPFAVIHLDGSFVHVEFKQPIAGTGKFEVYAAPPVPSVPDGWIRAIDEAMVVHHIGIADRADSYEVAKKKLNELLAINSDIARYCSEPLADVARDAKPDIWRVMCGDWRDKTVAIHNSAGYITCGLDPAKAAVLVRAHNGEMSDGGAAIAEVKGQS